MQFTPITYLHSLLPLTWDSIFYCMHTKILYKYNVIIISGKYDSPVAVLVDFQVWVGTQGARNS